jgi:pyridoxal phosphate enzyme (YggS family)
MFDEIKGYCNSKNVALIAVSKTHSPDSILHLFHKGQRDFAENKVQEMVSKREVLPQEIQWHFIGHLQTNKVKYIADFVHMIQSVDSLKLCKEINKQAQLHSRVIDCLLQVKVAKEDSKYGIEPSEIFEFIDEVSKLGLSNIRIKGIMGMSTFTEDQNIIKDEFIQLKIIFDELRKRNPEISILSMGMSSDYQIAINNGSNMVRIGSLIFGERDYNFT